MKNYIIYLYPGFGYTLKKFLVNDVFNEEDAIEKLCSTLERVFFSHIDDLTEEEIEEKEEQSDRYMYVDSTPYDGKCGYLFIENMLIEEKI